VHIKDLEHLETLENAYLHTCNNHSHCFIWYPVRTKAGCIIEVGGTNKEFKVNIGMEYAEGRLIFSTDGYLQRFVSFDFFKEDNYCRIETSDSVSKCDKFKTIEELLNFLDNKDLNKMNIKIKPVYKTVFSHNEIDWTMK